jgi:dephospho-CoA kinase
LAPSTSSHSTHPEPARAPGESLVIGVLGGIASGKSEVARRLAGPDGVAIDADQLVAELYQSSDAREKLRARFGPEVLQRDGSVDRAQLARRIFAEPGERKWLEDWIHRAVRARILSLIDRARAARAPRIVLDVPLLLENDAQHHLSRQCHRLVFVDAPLAARNARAIASRGWNDGEVARREVLQLPLDEKRARAHHVILNRGGLQELQAAVDALLPQLEETSHASGGNGP